MSISQDFPFHRDLISKFLPFLVGLMVYLATVFFIFTLFVVETTSDWKKQLANHLTIEIPPTPGRENTLQTRVLETLKQTPGILQATVVPSEDLNTLLCSLLEKEDISSPQELLDISSVPVLIEVVCGGEGIINTEELETHLKSISPGIRVIDHRAWQEQFLKLVRIIIFLTSLLTCLIFLAALVVTIFAVRTSLLVHQHVIDILHLMGATDGYIARQFQLHIFKKGLVAGVFGAGLAFCTFLVLKMLLDTMGGAFIFSFSFLIQAVVISCLIPLLMSVLMMFLARSAVIKELYS